MVIIGPKCNSCNPHAQWCVMVLMITMATLTLTLIMQHCVQWSLQFQFLLWTNNVQITWIIQITVIILILKYYE